MRIAVLVVSFHLHACQSLKEKRGRIKGLLDRFGKNKNIAACESAYHDDKTQSKISFVSVGTEARVIEANLAKIVDFCANSVDAELIDHYTEWL